MKNKQIFALSMAEVWEAIERVLRQKGNNNVV